VRGCVKAGEGGGPVRGEGRLPKYTAPDVSADAAKDRELEYAPVPANGPVRAIEPRSRFLPALPLSGTALAATSGFLAGAAVLATLRAVRSRRWLRRGRGRREKARSVVASRSFLVDIHLLGR
jgi:hypothetical protein